MTTAHLVDNLIERQLQQWPLARDNYAALEHVALRAVTLSGSEVILQHNSARRRSSAARVDAASLAGRPCFLCRENQPDEQEHIAWRETYKIQINPYPIFPRHLTIASLSHTPQLLFPPERLNHLLDLAEELPEWVLFYNGPRAGASAPDHMHFQAACAGYMPLPEQALNPALWPEQALLESNDDGFIGFTRQLGRPLFLIRCERKELAGFYLARLQLAMRMALDHEPEPMQNLLCWQTGEYTNVAVLPRVKHRPDCFGEETGQMLLSPGAVDMAGLWCIARKTDFDALTAERIQSLYDELCPDNAAIAAIVDKFYQT